MLEQEVYASACATHTHAHAQPYALCIYVHARQVRSTPRTTPPLPPSARSTGPLWLVCLSKTYIDSLSLSLSLGFISEYSYSLDTPHTLSIKLLFLFELSTNAFAIDVSTVDMHARYHYRPSQSRFDALLVFIDVESAGRYLKLGLADLNPPSPTCLIALFDLHLITASIIAVLIISYVDSTIRQPVSVSHVLRPSILEWKSSLVS